MLGQHAAWLKVQLCNQADMKEPTAQGHKSAYKGNITLCREGGSFQPSREFTSSVDVWKDIMANRASLTSLAWSK